MSNIRLLAPRRLIGLIELIILCFSAPSQPLFAQDTSHTVSIAVPESLETIFEDTILPPFLEMNPDISVSVVIVSDTVYRDLTRPSSQGDLDKYLTAAETLVKQADVLFMWPLSLSPEATQAGYFLDLAPLIAGDAQLPIEDFIPAAWQSYQWDSGHWAMPARVTPLIVTYDSAAFDAKGLTYPTEQWTLDEFANAARALAEPDLPGFQIYSVDVPVFLRTFLQEDFADDSVPARPQFDDPELVRLMEQWATLQAEGVVTDQYVQHPSLQFTRLTALEDRDLTGVLGFKGQAGLDVLGLALSSGTNDVEAAYQLAVYLTSAPELQTVLYDGLPARYSVTQDFSQGVNLPPAARELSDDALENALPISETLFGSYIMQALPLITDGRSAAEALQDAQQEAEASLVQAEAKRGGVAIVVPMHTPAPDVQADEIVIKFGLFTGGTGLPNRTDWERAIEELVARDDDVDRVEFNFVPSTQDYWERVPENKCIYGYWIDWLTDDQLMPLDPLIATDPTFDSEDVVGNLMQEMKRNDQTFQLPVTISPYVLRYDRQAFEKVGLTEPRNTWTVNEFIDALEQLEAERGSEPLQFMYNYSTPWEMLMAGYGSPLVDYSTPHPTLNLSDANVVPVAQQVFDLSQNGLVSYARMATFFGSGGPGGLNIPLLADYFTIDAMASDTSRYGIVTFPISGASVPVSYYTTNGFISSDAQHPEACYRWLREISRHPELYQGMPAYRTIIESPATQAVYGAKGVETFKFLADMMESPNSVFIKPYGLETGERMFLTRAFDRYMLEEADLEAELQQASELIEVYRVCYEDKQDPVACLLETDPTIRDNLPANVLQER